MFAFEVRQGKLKFLNFFFPGKCFLTVKILGNRSMKNLFVSAVPGLDLFCLCRGAGSSYPGLEPHIYQCAPTFKPAAKSLWESLRSFAGLFPGQGLCVWGKFLLSEVGILGLFSVTAVPFSQLNSSTVQLC